MGTRGQAAKATVLLPCAVLSSAWTVMLAVPHAAAVDGQTHGSNMMIRRDAVEVPASVSEIGLNAASLPGWSSSRAVADTSIGGIPAAALGAYQRSAIVIDQADPRCHLEWSLLAAIGRVESNHGRYGGNVLNARGVSTPGIYGISLDGARGTARIPDTDEVGTTATRTSTGLSGPCSSSPQHGR